MENARRQGEKVTVKADSCVDAHWPFSPYARYVGDTGAVYRFYPPLTETPPRNTVANA